MLGPLFLLSLMRYFFPAVVTQDASGMYTARVPSLPGCHTQAKTLPLLYKRMEEVIQLCVEVQEIRKNAVPQERFIGVQQIEVTA